MTCGQRYASLLQVRGFGPQEPTGLKPWASEADVRAWLAVAGTVFDLVRSRWNQLIDAEQEIGDFSGSASIRSSVEQYERDFDTLPNPSWWMVAGADAQLGQVVSNAQIGTCALDQVMAQLESLGQNAPVPFAPEPINPSEIASNVGFGAGAIVALAAVGAGLYLLTRKQS